MKLDDWKHAHTFGTDRQPPGERRTHWVIGLTVVMMGAEIAAGMLFGSMALLADGWHMGTHAAALGIAAYAYSYARRHAGDPRFSFGTGKVGALGGFASAVVLAVVALIVAAESIARIASPRGIHFNEAIVVAVIGLVVNIASAWILHLPGADHQHDEGPSGHHSDQQHHDHNLRGAYLHVIADALTSLTAIFALLLGKYLGWIWMDPAMGIVGALLIARWSVRLLRDTSRVLLDAEVGPERRETVRRAIEKGGDCHVTDLHLWRVGPRHLAAIISVVSTRPRPPEHYKGLLASERDLAHITIEVQRYAPASDEETTTAE